MDKKLDTPSTTGTRRSIVTLFFFTLTLHYNSDTIFFSHWPYILALIDNCETSRLRRVQKWFWSRRPCLKVDAQTLDVQWIKCRSTTGTRRSIVTLFFFTLTLHYNSDTIFFSHWPYILFIERRVSENEGHRHSKIKILIWKLKGKWHFGATFIDNAGKKLLDAFIWWTYQWGSPILFPTGGAWQ
jgi:hypothetical protein